MMDLNPNWFGRNNQRGTISFRFGPMNCGKTLDTVTAMNHRHHEGGNIVCYNHAANSRDGNSLAVNGQRQLPAVIASSLDDVIKDLEKRAIKIFSRKISNQGEKGKIEIDGISHRKYRPIVAIALDEGNLYAMSANDAAKLIDFFEWSREIGLNVYASGLMYDFRGNKFGHIDTILPKIEHIIPVTSAKCKAVSSGKVCGEAAYNSQRVWSVEFLLSQQLGEVGEGMELYDFADKDGEIISGKYVAAPYFDKTLRIEEAQDGRVEYFPVCHSCFEVPFKNEVHQIYEKIVKVTTNMQETIKTLESPELALAVISYLKGEKFENGEYLKGSKLIEEDKNGWYTAIPFFKTAIGSFEKK